MGHESTRERRTAEPREACAAAYRSILEPMVLEKKAEAMLDAARSQQRHEMMTPPGGASSPLSSAAREANAFNATSSMSASTEARKMTTTKKKGATIAQPPANALRDVMLRRPATAPASLSNSRSTPAVQARRAPSSPRVARGCCCPRACPPRDAMMITPRAAAVRNDARPRVAVVRYRVLPL